MRYFVNLPLQNGIGPLPVSPVNSVGEDQRHYAHAEREFAKAAGYSRRAEAFHGKIDALISQLLKLINELLAKIRQLFRPGSGRTLHQPAGAVGPRDRVVSSLMRDQEIPPGRSAAIALKCGTGPKGLGRSRWMQYDNPSGRGAMRMP